MQHTNPKSPRAPTYLVVALSVFFGISGIGYAAKKIDTSDIENGAVTTKKLDGGAVTRAKIDEGAVNASRVADDSLTGASIRESTLGLVPNAENALSAASAESADNADQAANATHAVNANHAVSADTADNADNANHALAADTADNASHAEDATSADNALALAGATGSQLNYTTNNTEDDPVTVLSASGLRIIANCDSGTLTANAKTTTNHAYISSIGMDAPTGSVVNNGSDANFNLSDSFPLIPDDKSDVHQTVNYQTTAGAHVLVEMWPLQGAASTCSLQGYALTQ
jgi:hypothetical protein